MHAFSLKFFTAIPLQHQEGATIVSNILHRIYFFWKLINVVAMIKSASKHKNFLVYCWPQEIGKGKLGFPHFCAEGHVYIKSLLDRRIFDVLKWVVLIANGPFSSSEWQSGNILLQFNLYNAKNWLSLLLILCVMWTLE